ncbi:MAG: helix-turn-helix domain-containing protein [Clostridiales bacterium]|nr:helix-turn-helix domain-containing protein [Clostridiales bacterium]
MSTASIGQRLRQARLALGYTQEQLAEQIHVSRQTISNWENDRSMPDYSVLKPLAEVLGLDVATFFQEPAKPPATQVTPSPDDEPTPPLKGLSKRKLTYRLILLALVLVVGFAAAYVVKQPQQQPSGGKYSLEWFAQPQTPPDDVAYLRVYSRDAVVQAKRGSPLATPMWRYHFYMKEEHNIGLTVQLLTTVTFLKDGTSIIDSVQGTEIGDFIDTIYIGPGEIRWLEVTQVADDMTLGVGCAVEAIDTSGNEVVSRLYLPFENEFE